MPERIIYLGGDPDQYCPPCNREHAGGDCTGRLITLMACILLFLALLIVFIAVGVLSVGVW